MNFFCLTCDHQPSSIRYAVVLGNSATLPSGSHFTACATKIHHKSEEQKQDIVQPGTKGQATKSSGNGSRERENNRIDSAFTTRNESFPLDLLGH